jgi:hypothetical protein
MASSTAEKLVTKSERCLSRKPSVSGYVQYNFRLFILTGDRITDRMWGHSSVLYTQEFQEERSIFWEAIVWNTLSRRTASVHVSFGTVFQTDISPHSSRVVEKDVQSPAKEASNVLSN